MPIPELPGFLIRDPTEESWLKTHVASLCLLENPEKFPGSQPVSFGVHDLDKLEKQDFWVCEKSDGVRVLFLIVTDSQTQNQTIFLIDRHNTYRRQEGFYFPHYENPRDPLKNTLIDGELVLDVDNKTGRTQLRFLAFDCLVIDNQNVMSKTLDKRYGRLDMWLHKPYRKMLADHPHMVEKQPFEIRVKEINNSYHVEKIFMVDIPTLQHGTDGLIYTCVSTPYTPGTDRNILKWKPPSENSVDFKLVLRFPPSPYNPKEPDWHAKPVFLLYAWCGESRYEVYDDLYVTDEEWEELKRSGDQVDDRIVEVHWDAELSRWRMMRFRDDKPHGNHKSVIEMIIQSIADGVEKETLLGRCAPIRNAWKARMMQPPPPPPPSLPGSTTSSYPTRSLSSHAYPPQKQTLPADRGGPSVLRYGPIAQSPWSKVAGPPYISGMKR